LRHCDPRHGGRGDDTGCQMQKFSAGKFHGDHLVGALSAITKTLETPTTLDTLRIATNSNIG